MENYRMETTKQIETDCSLLPEIFTVYLATVIGADGKFLATDSREHIKVRLVVVNTTFR